MPCLSGWLTGVDTVGLHGGALVVEPAVLEDAVTDVAFLQQRGRCDEGGFRSISTQEHDDGVCHNVSSMLIDEKA